MPAGPQLDFDTGKLTHVAQQLRGDRRREYQLLGGFVATTCLPVLVAMWWYPVATACLLLFAAYFQTLLTFATSTSTKTSHHLRFLLAGSNPIGMTGGSALLFGAVDAWIDWQEDRRERHRRPLTYWPLLIYKLAMTPVGVVLFTLEYAWDALLMRRLPLLRLKWHELFSLAWFHDLICPEKSNDIFYADLAFARFREDAYLYQWNRLRAMVFELEHYRQDRTRQQGVATSNLFWQDDLTAYQTLKRLDLETIEAGVATHFQDHPEMLPVPLRIAERLVHNARPISHYLRMNAEWQASALPPDAPSWQSELRTWCAPGAPYAPWHVLRVLDAGGQVDSTISDYLPPQTLEAMHEANLLAKTDEHTYELAPEFQSRLQQLLNDFFVELEPSALVSAEHLRLPTYLTWDDTHYAPRATPP